MQIVNRLRATPLPQAQNFFAGRKKTALARAEQPSLSPKRACRRAAPAARTAHPRHAKSPLGEGALRFKIISARRVSLRCWTQFALCLGLLSDKDEKKRGQKSNLDAQRSPLAAKISRRERFAAKSPHGICFASAKRFAAKFFILQTAPCRAPNRSRPFEGAPCVCPAR